MARCSLVLLLLSLSACTSASLDDTSGEPPNDDPDSNASDDEEPTRLHEDTLLIEEHPCFVAASPNDDNSIIDFELDCDPEDVGLEVGRIVSGTEGGGYLRRVESLAFDGDTVRAWTSFASLAEAVSGVDIVEHYEWGARQVVDFSGRTLDESLTEDGREARAIAERGIINIDPELDIDAEIRWFRLKKATATVTVNLGYDVQALMEAGSELDRGDTIDLDTLEFPFETRVGPVKLRGHLAVTVRLAWQHVATGEVSDRFGFAGNGTIVMGGIYTAEDDGWERIWRPEYSGEVTEQVVGGSADHTGRMAVQIEAILHMDKVEGSTFRYEPWNSGTVTGSCEELSFESAGGIKGETTMVLGFFDSGVRSEDYPALDIEADRKDGLLVHDTPPAGCEGGGDDDDHVPPIEDVTGECTPIADLACGATFSGNTASDPWATSNMDGYPCNVGNYDGPEMSWRFVAQQTGPVEVAFEGAAPMEVNHDILILDGSSGACSSSMCLAQGFNSVTFDAVAGQAYFVVVDGYYQEAGGFVATLTCGS